MRTDDFDYDLPSGSIAQEPHEPRDACRLLVLDRASGQIDHRRFSDIVDYLRSGDVLVVNETRVLPARLKGAKDETGGAVEVLLLRERYDSTWECLVKPGRRVKAGARLVFGEGALRGLVVDTLEDSGARLIRFTTESGLTFREAVHAFGEVPLPPYITRPLQNPESYQTVFAREERSAAAPTAGLHFTPELVARIEALGVRIARVELDVGIDTFRPVAEEDPTRHIIHSEHFRVPRVTAEVVNEARERGDRVIAVGTTSVRALESAWDDESGCVVAQERATDLYILPGYRFSAVDAMVTNFHTPRSTLLMMVSAFAGRELVMGAYEEAIERGYRLLSFGDAMLIS
ncbi:MAG: tRNA preQ1(34) S-adenosylmethionine ribosyltransferase-isomerase QueA [Coriobacteriia bacterium]|nr:tRNA preQ1(34) S-adenosylmethionine ribosyltransferase-isomerase QueA [Coriobacteriia bacterium]